MTQRIKIAFYAALIDPHERLTEWLQITVEDDDVVLANLDKACALISEHIKYVFLSKLHEKKSFPEITPISSETPNFVNVTSPPYVKR